MAALTRAQIPDTALGSAEKLLAYALTLGAYHSPTTKRIEVVGGAAILAYTADPQKFPDGNTYLVGRVTLPLNPAYNSNGLALWENALTDPDMANIEAGYKQAGT